MAEIAFFGLGTMGVPMAINLLKAGHHLHVLPHNGHMDGPLAVQEYGACIHETLQETVGNAEFIISVVPDDAAVRDLYLNQAMLEAIRPGTIIIEMTSCSPEIVREVARFFAEKQVRLIDAPITGAFPKAIDGTLTIMGAGDPAAFAAAAARKVDFSAAEALQKRHAAAAAVLAKAEIATGGDDRERYRDYPSAAKEAPQYCVTNLTSAPGKSQTYEFYGLPDVNN